MLKKCLLTMSILCAINNVNLANASDISTENKNVDVINEEDLADYDLDTVIVEGEKSNVDVYGNKLLPGDFLLSQDRVGVLGNIDAIDVPFTQKTYSEKAIETFSEGKILFNGKNIDELSFRQTALDLAVVAQHNFYNFDFKVLDVVLMGRSPHKKILERDNKKDYDIAYKSLEIVGLKDFAKRSFTTLSGGEQQRVILARALTQETESLILDEPTNHLDIKYQLQIMDIVKSLNLTVIAAIHDLNIAAMYCDRLVALKDGQIVGAGKPKDLLTEKFIKDLYEVDTKIEALPNDNINIRFLPKHFK